MLNSAFAEARAAAARLPARCLAAAALLVSIAPQLNAQDAPALNTEQVRRELDKLEADRTQASSARLARQLAALKPGAEGGSASARLYQEAVEAVDFQGRREPGQTPAEWRKANADLLRSAALQQAVQFHVRYLILGLQYAAELRRGGDPDLANTSWDYSRDLAAALLQKDLANPPGPARDLLFKPASQGVFARWLVLEDWLPSGDAWEGAPGNLAGILEKNVRPHWRKTSDPRLIGTWDLQLEFEAARITEKGLDTAADRFNNHDRPRLLFARARDRAAIGQPNRAVADVMQLLRDYPVHPDAAKWTEFVRTQLPPAPADPGATPSSASTPGPA